MHKYLRYGFIENLETVRRIPAGRLWGIPISVTPVTWLFPFVFFSLRLALGAFGPPLSLPDRLYDAGLFTLVVAVGTGVHALGHILGGLLVGGPMDELLLTATRGVNMYNGDQTAVRGNVHLGRSLGGPALNLLAAGALALLAGLFTDAALLDVVDRLRATNLFIGLGALLPLPSIDGEVIWREVARWVRSRPPF